MTSQTIMTQRSIKPILLTSHEVRLNRTNMLVIDVQNPKFMTCMIPGAKRLSIDVFLKDISIHQPILITSLTGQRSFSAAQQLIKRGYCEVYVLKGGIMAWQSAKLTVWLTKLPS
ncbi:rhodanese-like domain-containing protein [Altericista sp. CCNU0014]|uniref:rhodanese-like domain-containing protein n=1 Tax=Altericista sp. CCNU0014 TaxID=3082949 RepID=UPI00385006C4